MELVSVIVPVYNIEKYIAECLKSIQKQTYENLQIIVVDDGSSDKSGIICDKFAENDSRFEVIHKENGGAACAKNDALDRIRGEYFVFVDGDDYIDEDMIEQMIFISQKEDADIVEAGYYEEYSTKCINCEITRKKRKFNSIEYVKKYTNTWTNSLLWNKLYKTNLTKNVRFHTERRCIDDEFYTYKTALNAKKIVQIPDCFYHYRKRKGSAINLMKHENQRINDIITFLSERYENVITKYPELQLCYLKHMADSFLVIKNNCYLDKKLKRYFRKKIKKYFLKFILNDIGIGMKIELIKMLFWIKDIDIDQKKLQSEENQQNMFD